VRLHTIQRQLSTAHRRTARAQNAASNREDNVDRYLQGRKAPNVQRERRPSTESLHLIRKLRWIGMEQEAEQAQIELRCTATVGAVVTFPSETD
jgi:hypothetical protein